MNEQELKKEIALELHSINAVKFGDFTYVSGIKSPIYVDLRLLISYPKTMKKVAKIYAKKLAPLRYDRLAGVAYAALPIAGAISLEMEKPWIFMRKEGVKKAYGLKKALEGEYNAGETVAMIEDLATTGGSLIKAIEGIAGEDLVIKDAVVLLDYGKGGTKNLAEKGVVLHAFMTMHELVDIMRAEGKIDAGKHQESITFLES
jgi:orotate phosphoribosyltransferase